LGEIYANYSSLLIRRRTTKSDDKEGREARKEGEGPSKKVQTETRRPKWNSQESKAKLSRKQTGKREEKR